MAILKRYAKVSALLAAAVAVVALPSPASAQGGVQLVPWVGAYIPTRNEFSDLDNAVFDRDISVIGGARLTFWGTGRLGFEATGGYAPARIGDETINETGNTDLLLANARLLFALSPITNSVGFYLAGGPALLVRGTNPFDDDRSGTDFGANVGIGLRFALGESGRTAIRFDLEDYLYDGDFGTGLSSFQNDIVASLGLSIALGGNADSNDP
ncbi:MAG: outer membrane beta-barrel protein [Gemmatimonadales bacterium]